MSHGTVRAEFSNAVHALVTRPTDNGILPNPMLVVRMVPNSCFTTERNPSAQSGPSWMERLSEGAKDLHGTTSPIHMPVSLAPGPLFSTTIRSQQEGKSVDDRSSQISPHFESADTMVRTVEWQECPVAWIKAGQSHLGRPAIGERPKNR